MSEPAPTLTPENEELLSKAFGVDKIEFCPTCDRPKTLDMEIRQSLLQAAENPVPDEPVEYSFFQSSGFVLVMSILAVIAVVKLKVSKGGY